MITDNPACGLTSGASGTATTGDRTVFDLRTATAEELLERADYLDNFPATQRGYRAALQSEARGLRKLAAAKCSKVAEYLAEQEEYQIWNNSRIGGRA